MVPACAFLLCAAAGVFQTLLETWALSSFLHTGSTRNLSMGVSTRGPWLCLSLFFSFFQFPFFSLIFVGRVLQRKKQKQEEEKVGGTDGQKGWLFMESLRTLSLDTTGFREVLR